jgi:light-independent protochlorophyllide reductase subunit B
MGFEGANVIFDTWVHPLMMGLEEHLLTMFRGDFEFNDAAPASHLNHTAPQPAPVQPTHAAPGPAAGQVPGAAPVPGHATWAPDAERELAKIPFFVRGKARRNTEKFAAERRVEMITVETLYDAKAHFSR